MAQEPTETQFKDASRTQERHIDWDKVETAGLPAVIAILKSCHLVFHDGGEQVYDDVRPYTFIKDG